MFVLHRILFYPFSFLCPTFCPHHSILRVSTRPRFLWFTIVGGNFDAIAIGSECNIQEERSKYVILVGYAPTLVHVITVKAFFNKGYRQCFSYHLREFSPQIIGSKTSFCSAQSSYCSAQSTFLPKH